MEKEQIQTNTEKELKKIESSFYDSLKEEMIKKNPQTNAEVQEVYTQFMKNYKEKIRKESNFITIQDRVKREIYLEQVKEDKEQGFNKSMKFHTGWDALFNQKIKPELK